jgi:DNA (cytosine-5)-methyltransferase 1
MRNKRNKNKIVFRLAELFCGPGGLALGAMSAAVENDNLTFSIKPIWANDIDEDTCKTYRRNIHPAEPTSVACAPIKDVNFSRVPKFDALAFGFPCNDFSVVGEQKGFKGTYGPLYTYGVKAIKIHNPKWFVAENVGGLQSANNGLAFKKVLSDLECAGKGYNLTVHLYKFEEYGIPQNRHRIVIVGIRKDLKLRFKVPAPSTANNYISASEAIENPPIPNDAPNNEITKQSPKVVERLKFIPPGENAWYKGLPLRLRLNVKSARMSQIYKRLHPGKPSYTITGSGGGGTHTYHWNENRALTNRERARLQSFPDNFVFEGSKESVRKQIGMAVPPKAAQVIFDAILKTFAGIEYPYITAKFGNDDFLRPQDNTKKKTRKAKESTIAA